MKNKLIKEYKKKLYILDREFSEIQASIGEHRKNNFGHERLSLALGYLDKQRQLVVKFLKDMESL